MSPVITLAFPFFGLIILGFGCGKLMKIPEDGLRWMNFFIVYIALPPLFFKLIGATPFEQLTNWRFILTTTLCTYIAFVLSFGMGIIASRGNIREAAPIRMWAIWGRGSRWPRSARNQPCRQP